MDPEYSRVNMTTFGDKAVLPVITEAHEWTIYSVILALSSLARVANEFFSEIAVYAINECLKFVVSLSTVDLLLPVVRLVQFINTVLMDFYVPFASQLQGWEQEAVEELKYLSQADGSFITLTLNA